ncbi:hypothetical protein [Serratia proteamaculans]|uniref:hypothetical protein n=1 Tax=Serratia proteamaculans TaxID=28151 RepID=UPI003D027AC0
MTQTLTTTEELKHLASSDNTNVLTRSLARECLANREAQPVGYIDTRCLEGKYPTGGSWSLRPYDLSGVNQVTPIYLSAPPAPAVPEEMTKEDAMGFVRERPPFKGSVECVQTTRNACRAAMLAAAPEGGN